MKKSVLFKQSLLAFSFLIQGYFVLNAQNILLNPGFEFHSFVTHREGKSISYSSGYVAFWNAENYGDIEVIRESHLSDSIRPRFSTHNLISIKPGKKIHQFFTLPEAGLAHGDHLTLKVHGYQYAPAQLKAKILLMKLDSEDGEWSPKDFGMRDQRTFPRHSRGELVVAREYSITSPVKGTLELVVPNAEITGKVSEGNKSSSSDINTIGIMVEFENTSTGLDAWIYAPSLTTDSYRPVPDYRAMIPYYTGISRTIQKLWKGEPVHIIVMGSSIDRGSANPPMYLYDEDPTSKTYKQPLADGIFDAAKAGRPELEGSYGQWRHYHSYAGRLKLELMRKFNLSPDKILLNFMAADGSCVGEAHSGLKEYCSLAIPPDPELNGNAKGKSWKESYPGIFSRPEGIGPDLVIFGSGANEKTDTPDEVAVFEGMMRWITMHYPHTEFLGCQVQNNGGYTPNPGDMQALSLRYGFPYIDYGKTGDDVTRWCNRYALVPADGHPQAASHYLWFKQIEKAFECWDPVMPGHSQVRLPERVHRNTYSWEGEMETYDTTSKRITNNRFILDDVAVNCWGKADTNPPVVYLDGSEWKSRSSFQRRDLRNSSFRGGNGRLGDRHVLEMTGDNCRLLYVDSKVCPGRRYYSSEDPSWMKNNIKARDYISAYGAPYGSRAKTLLPGRQMEIDVICTDLSVAYVDAPAGGIVEVIVDDSLVLSQQANIPITGIGGWTEYIENRKGILNLGFGLHHVVIRAKNSPVDILGIFTYDSRSNLASQRQVTGMARGGDIIEFTLPFRSRPVVICSGDLKVSLSGITKESVRFTGGQGMFQVTGE